ncbi:MAG TPA: glycosyltransferase, partial [Thermoguttaceae bacterium]|nr:glycosyltransferase [Thermoguttaceae bacterium]
LVLVRAEGPFLDNMSVPVRVVDLGAHRVLASLPALVRYLKSVRPDAILSMMAYANIVALWAHRLAKVATRTIVSERSALPHPNNLTGQSPLRERILRALRRRYYPWADAIVAVSDGVADELAFVARIPRERIRVIYNPVMRPQLREAMREPVDHPWFDEGQPPVLLAAGRLRPQKDFPTLIRAFAQVRRSRPLRLVILGEGTQRQELEELVRRLGLESYVSMPGFVANPYAYMARSSLFVLSSNREGLPGALIEAMCCGTPVIATDCPAGPREILCDGRFGQLIPIGEVDTMAQAIRKVLDEQLPSPPPDSWSRFEIDAVVDEYIDTLLGN